MTAAILGNFRRDPRGFRWCNVEEVDALMRPQLVGVVRSQPQKSSYNPSQYFLCRAFNLSLKGLLTVLSLHTIAQRASDRTNRA